MNAGRLIIALSISFAVATVGWSGDTALASAFIKPYSGLSARIPNGMCAIAPKSPAIPGVAEFMLAGTHVDELDTYRSENGEDCILHNVLQDARILAAGRKTQLDPEGKPLTVDAATLTVAPNDEEKVARAGARGRST